jgi:hypothetical protein
LLLHRKTCGIDADLNVAVSFVFFLIAASLSLLSCLVVNLLLTQIIAASLPSHQRGIVANLLLRTPTRLVLLIHDGGILATPKLLWDRIAWKAVQDHTLSCGIIAILSTQRDCQLIAVHSCASCLVGLQWHPSCHSHAPVGSHCLDSKVRLCHCRLVHLCGNVADSLFAFTGACDVVVVICCCHGVHAIHLRSQALATPPLSSCNTKQ